MKVTAKEKPKWFHFRWKLANWIVKLARLIHPENPEAIAFHMQQLMDTHLEAMLYGTSAIKIEHVPIKDWEN